MVERELSQKRLCEASVTQFHCLLCCCLLADDGWQKIFPCSKTLRDAMTVSLTPSKECTALLPLQLLPMCMCRLEPLQAHSLRSITRSGGDNRFSRHRSLCSWSSKQDDTESTRPPTLQLDVQHDPIMAARYGSFSSLPRLRSAWISLHASNGCHGVQQESCNQPINALKPVSDCSAVSRQRRSSITGDNNVQPA